MELKKLNISVVISFAFALFLIVFPSQAQDEQSANQRAAEERAEIHQYSEAYYVLGRDLTVKEIEAVGVNLTKEQIKTAFLAHEQKLVIVRALVATGAGADAKRVLEVYHLSELKTFEELVYYFTELKEKYGSVKTGIESEFVFNIKDDKEAFRKAAAKAYENVFGVPEDKQEKERILDFLIQKEATTYSKMIKVLVESMTPEMKKELLFNVLDETGRSDLKNNKQFIKKLLEQQLTYEHLIKLFKSIAPVKKK